jgi:hypothetical protein
VSTSLCFFTELYPDQHIENRIVGGKQPSCSDGFRYLQASSGELQPVFRTFFGAAATVAPRRPILAMTNPDSGAENMHVNSRLVRSLFLALSWAVLDASAATTAMSSSQTGWQDLGQDVVLQTGTGLRWTKKDNGHDIDWPDAKSWCARLGEGWRLPTVDELNGVAAAADMVGQHTPCGKAVCFAPPQFQLSAAWHWSDTPLTKAEAKDADELAWGVTMVNGHKTMGLRMAAYGARALCVRSR